MTSTATTSTIFGLARFGFHNLLGPLVLRLVCPRAAPDDVDGDDDDDDDNDNDIDDDKNIDDDDDDDDGDDDDDEAGWADAAGPSK